MADLCGERKSSLRINFILPILIFLLACGDLGYGRGVFQCME
jgi:hypothetical protein